MAETTEQQDEVAPTGTELYIGNLAWAVTSEDLTKAFAEFGALGEVRIVVSARTGQSKGFGFVTFSDKDAATKAMAEMDEKDFGGRALNVKLARDRSLGSAAAASAGPEKLCEDRLHFGNLPKEFVREDLEAKCKAFGEVSNVEVLSRRNHSFGYATFETPGAAQKALEALDAPMKVATRSRSCSLARRMSAGSQGRRGSQGSQETPTEEEGQKMLQEMMAPFPWFRRSCLSAICRGTPMRRHSQKSSSLLERSKRWP